MMKKKVTSPKEKGAPDKTGKTTGTSQVCGHALDIGYWNPSYVLIFTTL